MIKNPFSVMNSLLPSMHKVERAIGEFILSNPERILNMTVKEIANELKIADSSIVRFSQIIGYTGFSQLKVEIAKNLPQSDDKNNILNMSISKKDTIEIMSKKIFSHSIKMIEDTMNFIDYKELERAIDLIIKAKDIVIFGLGSSASIASDLHFKLSRVSIKSSFTTDSHQALLYSSNLDKNSLFFAVTHSGRTRETVDALLKAKEMGANIINLSSIAKSQCHENAHVNLIISSSETGPLSESISSQVAMEIIVNCIYLGIVLKKGEQAINKGKNTSIVLEEHRYPEKQ